MNHKLLQSLESQFGASWSCTCHTPFDTGRFEILTESNDSFLAHYTCSVCGREQMLAAALTKEVSVERTAKLKQKSALTANDVLDIKNALRKTPLNGMKSLLKSVSKPGLKNQGVETLLKSD